MPIAVQSPYARGNQRWLRGNLHTHTTNSDGPGPPQALVDAYAEHDYDFLMLSDHDYLGRPNTLDARGMTLIRGNEITADGPHMLHVGAREKIAPGPDRQPVISNVLESGGFAIMCHPNWEGHFNHCPQETLENCKGYAGIEIFNGVVSRLEGSPLATDRWDRLLGQGRRIWGFATDDTHDWPDIAQGWVAVQAEPDNEEDIVNALWQGRFYASSGVTIKAIEVDGNTITVRTKDAQRIAAFGDFARRLAQTEGTSLTFEVPDTAGYLYVRFECWGRGGAQAWTQPFFIERG